MTYLHFLGLFLLVPLVWLAAVAWLGARRQRAGPAGPMRRRHAMALLAHVAIAVAYTTPWDNYLVATSVWWYDPARVLGITLGWVPLEEYLFFMLQPLVAGLVLFVLAARPPAAAVRHARWLRAGGVGLAASIWLAAVLMLAAGWQPGAYLGLELAWALPPIGLQLAFGADILWRYRHSVLSALAMTTLYLGAADALAIGAGIWTIDPAQSLGWLIGGVLPVEEFAFFLLTNMLLTFGLALTVAPETRERWARLKAQLGQRRQPRQAASR